MLTKKAVAEYVEVTPLTVTRWEDGQEPSASQWDKIEQIFGYPKAFFYGVDLDEPTEASFRSLKSLTAARRDAALTAGVVGFMLSDWVDERFNLPASQVPDLGFYSPEEAASALRQDWALGEKPISNMLHMLESKGVRVFSLAENTKAVDAYSIWRNGTPYVFLNNQKSAERSRFDAAHELGHLVLHQDQKPNGRQAEDEANRFASAFLMPAADVNATIPYMADLGDFLSSKRRWKVSLAAILYRSHKLGLLSDWRYRDFSIEISKRGWNRNEPDPIERECSVVWEKVLRMLWSDRMTLSQVGRELSVPEAELHDLVYGLISTTTDQTPSGGSLRSIS